MLCNHSDVTAGCLFFHLSSSAFLILNATLTFLLLLGMFYETENWLTDRNIEHQITLSVKESLVNFGERQYGLQLNRGLIHTICPGSDL